MRIVFMGTPDFAVNSLKALLSAGHQVTLAVTREDKPRGRGQQLAFSDVKSFALTQDIPLYQPRSLRCEEVRQRLAAERPDVIVVVAYGRLLPENILTIPPYGCVNVHGSLLPRHRGAAPIQWTVLSGDPEGGVTTMRMNAGLETGDILMQSRRPVPDTMTSGELFDRLAEDGAALLVQTLEKLERGELTPVPQREEEATYAPMLSRTDSPLDWSLPAWTLHNRVRGLNPWPGASVPFGGKTLKIHVSRVGEAAQAAPGTVISLRPLTVACGQGTSLQLLEVQYEGARRMTAGDFLCGHPVKVGQSL